MTTLLIAVLIYIPTSLVLALAASRRRDAGSILLIVLIAWLVLSLLTTLVNDIMPFADGGDDYLYYYSTQIYLSVGGIFDLNRFAGLIEQPGYPLLLGPLSVIAADDLLSYKLLNLFLFVATALTWYRIGTVLVSPEFGRSVMIAILLTTPLWYYVFFLLKEMSIVLPRK